MDRTAVIEQLEALTTEYGNGYARIAEESRAAILQNLKPGEKAPAEGRILGDEYKAKFEGFAAGCLEKANAIIDEAAAGLYDDLAKPDPDAVSVLQLMQMQDHVSPMALDAAFKKYGGNFNTFKALDTVARKNRISHGYKHEVDENAKFLESAKHNIGSIFNAYDAINNGYNKAGAAFAIHFIKNGGF